MFRSLFASVLLVAACSAETTSPNDFPYAPLPEGGGKAEAWNQANDPMKVDDTFVVELAALPKTGKATRVPWPGDYWATAYDSLNVRWDGEGSLSPAEKWEKAFGATGFAKTVTRELGVLSVGGKSCTSDAQCADDEACGIARGASKGRCIPTWFGICHGWAPAAIAEKQAKKSVVVNGVTFYPGDLEGLMSAAWGGEDYPVRFIAERCDADSLPTDSLGRIRDAVCRDMNAGALHVVLGNMLGLRGLGIVEDRTADSEVWNQPVAGYKVKKQQEISKAEAAALVGATSYTFNSKAKRFVSVETDLSWITESSPGRKAKSPATYTRVTKLAYVLELDEAGKILGGEWVGASKTQHPDFLWWPAGQPSGEAVPGLDYATLKSLYDQAVE